MPRRDARLPRSLVRPAVPARLLCLAIVLVAVSTAACSRLTFVRPDLGDVDYRQIAPDYQASDGNQAKSYSTALIEVRKGQQALQDGDLAAAEKSARKALDLNRDFAPALTLLATVYDRQGRADAAGAQYRKAAEVYPRGASFNNYGTWMCSQSGREAESLEWFDRALADPGYATPSYALANAGSCADKAGLDGRAGPYLQRALQIDPENPLALETMAARELRKGDAFKARAFSERRLAAAPASPSALVLASQIERTLGDNDAAERYVRDLRAEFPGAAGSDTGEGGSR